MEDVSIAHAKDHLAELVERAARGEDVRISDPTLGTVRLVKDAAPAPTTKRRLGLLEGKFKIPERLMEPMTEEELADWYGD